MHSNVKLKCVFKALSYLCFKTLISLSLEEWFIFTVMIYKVGVWRPWQSILGEGIRVFTILNLNQVCFYLRKFICPGYKQWQENMASCNLYNFLVCLKTGSFEENLSLLRVCLHVSKKFFKLICWKVQQNRFWVKTDFVADFSKGCEELSDHDLWWVKLDG